MHEIYIHKAYGHDELTNLLNQHLADNVDGVIMCWKESTSVFIDKLNNITIEETQKAIQHLLGNVQIDIDPDIDNE